MVFGRCLPANPAFTQPQVESAGPAGLRRKEGAGLLGLGSREVWNRDPMTEEPRRNAPAGFFVKAAGTCWGHGRVRSFSWRSACGDTVQVRQGRGSHPLPAFGVPWM